MPQSLETCIPLVNTRGAFGEPPLCQVVPEVDIIGRPACPGYVLIKMLYHFEPGVLAGIDVDVRERPTFCA